jgi:hypothetical protein
MQLTTLDQLTRRKKILIEWQKLTRHLLITDSNNICDKVFTLGAA